MELLFYFKENAELYKLRNIKLSYPMFDPGSDNNTKYKDWLVSGNKIWRTETCDGVPCLYVIMGEIEYDYLENTINCYAEEVATEIIKLASWSKGIRVLV